MLPLMKLVQRATGRLPKRRVLANKSRFDTQASNHNKRKKLISKPPGFRGEGS